MVVLLQNSKGAESLNENEFAGLVKLLDIIERVGATAAESQQDEEEPEATTTLYNNPVLSPLLDILEKLMLCLFRALKTTTKARNKAMQEGVVTKVFRVLDVAKSSMLYSRAICGVLNVLLEVMIAIIL